MKEIQLGAKVKALRNERGLSLRALGEKTGFSAAFLSQVELEQAVPSLGSLHKIAAALGVRLVDLLAEPSHGSGPHVRRRESGSLRSEWSKATLQSLLPAGAHPRLGVLLIGLEPGGKSGKSPTPDTGEVFVYCVRGTIQLHLDDEGVTLSEGDSVFFEATRAARWQNDSDARAEVLLVTLVA